LTIKKLNPEMIQSDNSTNAYLFQKVRGNKLNPEMIQSDNSTNAYLFQKVRGNKLVSLKSQQPLQPAPQPAAGNF